MAIKTILGRNGRLYMKADGIENPFAEEDYIKVARVTEVNRNSSRSTDDVTTKDSGDDVEYAAGLRDTSISFSIIKTDGVTDIASLTSLEAAYDDAQPIGIAIFTGDKTTVGSRGYLADMIVTKFDDSQPLGGAQKIEIELKKAPSDVPAYKHTVTA